MSAPLDIFVSYAQLADYGIGYCRVHLRRLIERGDLPRPVQLSANQVAWRERDLKKWQASRPEAGAKTRAA